MRKKIFLSAAILAAAVSAYAQGNGQAGITEATNLITGYFDQGGELDEVTVTATKAPSLWERMKQGAAWAAAIMILAAAGWIIYKFKKR